MPGSISILQSHKPKNTPIEHLKQRVMLNLFILY